MYNFSVPFSPCSLFRHCVAQGSPIFGTFQKLGEETSLILCSLLEPYIGLAWVLECIPRLYPQHTCRNRTLFAVQSNETIHLLYVFRASIVNLINFRHSNTLLLAIKRVFHILTGIQRLE